MIAVGFSGLLKALAFSNNSVVFTIGSLGEVLIWALLIHLLMSFPYGRLESGVDRLLVAIAYFNATVVQVAGFVLTDPAKAGCADCPANPLLITHSQASAAITRGAGGRLDRTVRRGGGDPLPALAGQRAESAAGLRPGPRRRQPHPRAPAERS